MGDQSITHTTRSGSGAPEPESSAQALARVDAFITDHQDRGDLVFQKRVDRDRVTEELLAELHTEAVALFAAFEGHAVRITTTPSCVVDTDKKYVFAATPATKARSSVVPDIAPRWSNSPKQQASAESAAETPAAGFP